MKEVISIHRLKKYDPMLIKIIFYDFLFSNLETGFVYLREDVSRKTTERLCIFLFFGKDYNSTQQLGINPK